MNDGEGGKRYFALFSRDLMKKGFRFGITTVAGAALNFGINIIGHECFGISVNIVYPIALVAVSISTFLQCRFFVYPGASRHNAFKQGGLYIVSNVIFRILEWALFFFLYNVVALEFHWWYVCCIIIVQSVSALSKFFFYNFFIFGRGPAAVPEPGDKS